jgi:hypothetical protein
VKSRARSFGRAVLVWGTFVLVASAGHARADGEDAEPSTARWRAESWGGSTFDGSGKWLNDGYAAVAIEHEWRQLWNIYMGLRALPAIAYFDDEPIVGTALGMTHRLYTSRDGSGLYAGPAVAVVLHYGRFEGNSAYVNFLSSFELGYQIPRSPLRLSARVEHMSNANTAEQNRGWNGVSLLIGWELPFARNAAGTKTPLPPPGLARR